MSEERWEPPGDDELAAWIREHPGLGELDSPRGLSDDEIEQRLQGVVASVTARVQQSAAPTVRS